MACDVGQQVRHPQAALTTTFEPRNRPGVRLLPGLRLVIEGIELRRSAGHVQEDNPLGSCTVPCWALLKPGRRSRTCQA